MWILPWICCENQSGAFFMCELSFMRNLYIFKKKHGNHVKKKQPEIPDPLVNLTTSTVLYIMLNKTGPVTAVCA